MEAVAVQDAPSDGACQRGLGRAQVALDSVIEIPRGRFKCQVFDLSLEGARVSFEEPVKPGQNLWLKLGSLRVFGTIQWAKGGMIGVRFDEKLPKAFVLYLLGESVSREAYREAEILLAARDWVVGAVPMKTGSMSAADMLSARSKKSEASGYLQDGIWWYLLNQQRQLRSERKVDRKNAAFILAGAAVLGSALGVASPLIF